MYLNCLDDFHCYVQGVSALLATINGKGRLKGFKLFCEI